VVDFQNCLTNLRGFAKSTLLIKGETFLNFGVNSYSLFLARQAAPKTASSQENLDAFCRVSKNIYCRLLIRGAAGKHVIIIHDLLKEFVLLAS